MPSYVLWFSNDKNDYRFFSKPCLVQDKRPIMKHHDANIGTCTRLYPGLSIFLPMTTSFIMSPARCLAQLFPWFMTVEAAVAVTWCRIWNLLKADDRRLYHPLLYGFCSCYSSYHNFLLHIIIQYCYQTTKISLMMTGHISQGHEWGSTSILHILPEKY